MLTALIRTIPGREKLLERAIMSAESQGCAIELIKTERVPDYSYNLLCNELKARVNDGYFFFLDDDDYVIAGSLELIERYLMEGQALIVPMLRSGRPKPYRPEIKKGYIGLPCMILHSKHKNLADVTAEETGDYHWIKSVTDKLPWNFIPIPFVNAGKRNHGKANII